MLALTMRHRLEEAEMVALSRRIADIIAKRTPLNVRNQRAKFIKTTEKPTRAIQLVSFAKLSIVSIASCQSSSDAEPSVSSFWIRRFKELDASAKRELSAIGELIEFKKSRSFEVAFSEASPRAPCNVSKAAAANWLSVLIFSPYSLVAFAINTSVESWQ
jgi:hypothetical protein